MPKLTAEANVSQRRFEILDLRDLRYADLYLVQLQKEVRGGQG